MPGRVTARSTQGVRSSKARTSSRTTSPTTNIPDEGETTSLREEICAIFVQAQRSPTSTRKHVVTLRKIQETCCYEPTSSKKRAPTEDFDENDFTAEILRCIVRILQIKKSEPAGDRLVKFVAIFLKYAADADNAIFQTSDSDAAFPETPSSRLSSYIISTVLPLLATKDKIIRLRSTQIVAHLINTLDSIDDELFHPIRLGLLKRLRDKESQIRAQAVYGLGRLANESIETVDNEDSDDDVSGSVLERLLDVLQNDPSGEVRRSLLLNLPFTPTTLPFLLERARDTDVLIRRALYARLLPALADFRHLSLTHREKLLRWGLRDRDEQVKKATARLFRERWIQDCLRPRDAVDQPAEITSGNVPAPDLNGLLELLERIDVVNAGNDVGIALDAMREFWQGRPDYCEFLRFDEAYWNDLTPESVFIARTFNDFCRGEHAPASFQEKLPEVSRFAFLLQQSINRMAEQTRKMALQDEMEEEMDMAQQEFIVEQLLQIALTLDYSDEVGRRTMFSLLREALALPELPEETTRLVTEALRAASGSLGAAEKEFVAVVLEAIAEVHDSILGDEGIQPQDEGDDSFHSARSELTDDTPRKPVTSPVADEEKAIREIMVNMKCLHVAQCMLQNIHCELEQNADLVTMLNNLVIPAVRSQEAPIRERGLLCLGLCCLLDKNLAEENLTLFLHCFTKGHEALQNIAIQIIADILCAHPLLLFTRTKSEGENNTEPVAEQSRDQLHPLQKPIHKLFSKGISSPSPSIQTTTCTALCKLMLSSPNATSDRVSVLDQDELLRIITIAYFNPETTANPSLRQSLSYFIPVYCHSRVENLQRMGRIALDVLQWCISTKDEIDMDGEVEAVEDMVSLGVVIEHLVDWTDGRKLVAALSMIGAQELASGECDDTHVTVAQGILGKILGVCSKEDRKLFVSMLGKLCFNPAGNRDKLNTLSSLISEVLEDRSTTDATTRNTLLKVQNSILKVLRVAERRQMSVVPTEAEGEEDDAPTVLADDVSEVDGSMIEHSTATTPAASPRKAGMGRTQPKPPKLGSRDAAESVWEENEATELPIRSVESEMSTSTVENEVVNDDNTPRAMRTIKSEDVDLEDTVISTAAAIVKSEPAILPISEATEPAKRPRGRPPRNPGVVPPRKSVRSGRRTMASISTEESFANE